MKKGLRSVAVLALCALSLTSCGEVKFADFQTKANEALKTEVKYKTGTVSGTVTTKSDSGKSENKISANLNVNGHVITPGNVLNLTTDVVYAALVNALSLATFSAAEVTDYKYYAGSDFKVTYDSKDEDGNKVSTTIKWNSNGLLTSYAGYSSSASSKGTYNLTVSYKE